MKLPTDAEMAKSMAETECRMAGHDDHEGDCKRSANPAVKGLMNYRACTCDGHGKAATEAPTPAGNDALEAFVSMLVRTLNHNWFNIDGEMSDLYLGELEGLAEFREVFRSIVITESFNQEQERPEGSENWDSHDDWEAIYDWNAKCAREINEVKVRWIVEHIAALAASPPAVAVEPVDVCHCRCYGQGVVPHINPSGGHLCSRCKSEVREGNIAHGVSRKFTATPSNRDDRNVEAQPPEVPRCSNAVKPCEHGPMHNYWLCFVHQGRPGLSMGTLSPGRIPKPTAAPADELNAGELPAECDPVAHNNGTCVDHDDMQPR